MTTELISKIESRHTLLNLSNVDQNFTNPPNLEDHGDIEFYSTGKQNDLIFFGTADIYGTIDALSKTPGIISSRTLILTDKIQIKGKINNKKKGILLMDSRYLEENKVLEMLKNIDEIYALYNSVGIYNIAAFVSFENEEELKVKINSIPLIRSATLLETDKQIIPSEVIKKQQEISSRHYNSRNKYEVDYSSSAKINNDYARGCIEMAKAMIELEERVGNVSTIYAPLRGSKPIVDTMLEAYRRLQKGNRDYFRPIIQYPVTSSFVFYPINHPYQTKKGKLPASGRTTNILELKRLRKTGDLSHILYVDEIVSGGMMVGHVKEMITESDIPERKGVLEDLIISGDINLTAFGLTHNRGSKFGASKRRYLTSQGNIAFRQFPIDNLVTEDQRFLLGIHYLINEFGPHSIPFIDACRNYSYERQLFIKDVADFINQHFSSQQ